MADDLTRFTIFPIHVKICNEQLAGWETKMGKWENIDSQACIDSLKFGLNISRSLVCLSTW